MTSNPVAARARQYIDCSPFPIGPQFKECADEIERLNTECEKWILAYKLAHQQAMENGARASAEPSGAPVIDGIDTALALNVAQTVDVRGGNTQAEKALVVLARFIRARAAASLSEPPSAWQPIETAPKDGSTVMIAGQYAKVGVWYVETSFYAPPGHWHTRKLDPPSHWMPLPGAPVTKDAVPDEREDPCHPAYVGPVETSARPPARDAASRAAGPDERVRCGSCDQGLLPGEVFDFARECCETGKQFDIAQGVKALLQVSEEGRKS